MAIRTSDPLAREMMAYTQVVLGEAQCHGGFGWIDYDRAARQQRAVDSRPRSALYVYIRTAEG